MAWFDWWKRRSRAEYGVVKSRVKKASLFFKRMPRFFRTLLRQLPPTRGGDPGSRSGSLAEGRSFGSRARSPRRSIHCRLQGIWNRIRTSVRIRCEWSLLKGEPRVSLLCDVTLIFGIFTRRLHRSVLLAISILVYQPPGLG